MRAFCIFSPSTTNYNSLKKIESARNGYFTQGGNRKEKRNSKAFVTFITFCKKSVDWRGRNLKSGQSSYPVKKNDISSLFASKNGRMDLVLIPTGISTHHPFTEMALTAGEHVFVEKPADPTVAGVDAMIEADSRLAEF